MSVKQQKTVKAMREAIKSADSKKTQPFDSSATVVRIDGNTAWVHFDGGVEETPVKRTINANVGDVVQVRVSGGSAWIVGNASSPPTDDAVANTAYKRANKAYDSALFADAKADEALANARSAEESAIGAQEIATRAQTSADGKNTIYYGDTQPTGGTYKKGDTWFNGSQGNAIYTYSGTAWVKEELGEDAIAELSIKTAHIQDGAITNAKVGNLDAGKITSGTIDVNRLNVGAIVSTGGIATDSEVASAKSDAEKVATNYLAYTPSAGVTIGYDGLLSKVNIKGDGIRLYDGNGNNNAFFGTDSNNPSIRIGNTNQRGHIRIDPTYGVRFLREDDSTRMAQIASDGMQIWNFENNTATSVAFFGTTARIGASGSSRFVMGASSLQAYNSSNTKYFEVSASGITYGSNTVANTSNVATAKSEAISTASNDATTKANNAKSEAISTASADATSKANTAEANGKKEATNYITKIDNNGIKIHALNNTSSNYASITADGLTVFKGGTQVGYFGSSARIGAPTDGNIYVSSSGLNVYKKETGDTNPVSVAFFGVDGGTGYSRLGASTDRHIEVTPDNGFCLYGANGTEYFRARDSFLRVGANTNNAVRLVVENNYLNFVYRDANGDDTIRAFIGYSSAQDTWYTRLRGNLTIDVGSIILPYQYSLRCKNSSGNERSMVSIDGSNYYFGYGAYSNSEGTSYYDGNNTTIRAKGNITFTAGIGGSGTISGNKAYTNTSDIRLKKDIEYLSEDTDEIILNLKPFKFHWVDKRVDEDDHYGVSAQDLKSELENKGIGGIVSEVDGYYGVAYSELIPMLIHLCQSQQREIDDLKEKLQ